MQSNMVTNRIQRTPGISGGDACIRDTRIAVWMLVQAQRLGLNDQELLNRYIVPLTSDDLESAWDYYRTHTDEVDEAIRRNEEA